LSFRITLCSHGLHQYRPACKKLIGSGKNHAKQPTTDPESPKTFLKVCLDSEAGTSQIVSIHESSKLLDEHQRKCSTNIQKGLREMLNIVF
jgi:hypothetical protein